jgi:hypothetical protein
MLETDPQLRGIGDLIYFVNARGTEKLMRRGWTSLPDTVRPYAIMMVPPEGEVSSAYRRPYANSKNGKIVGLQGLQPVAMATLGVVTYLPNFSSGGVGHYVWHGWDGRHELTMDAEVEPKIHGSDCFDSQNAAAVFWDCSEQISPLLAVSHLPEIEAVPLPSATLDGMSLADIRLQGGWRIWRLYEQREFGRHLRLPGGIFANYCNLLPEAPPEDKVVLFAGADEQSLWLALMLREQGVEWATEVAAGDWQQWLENWNLMENCPLAEEAKTFVEAQRALEAAG